MGKPMAKNLLKAGFSIVAVNIAAVGEAFTLGTKVGLDPQVVYQAIRGGLAARFWRQRRR